MIAAVEGLIVELRTVGIGISAAEHADALMALRHTELLDRAAVKAALGCALIKEARHESAYSAVFDLFFAPRGLDDSGLDGGGLDDGGGPAGGAGEGGVLGSLGDEAIDGLLLTALEADDATLLRALAALVVTRYAAIQPGRPVAGTQYLLRAMRAVASDSLPARLLAARAPHPGGDWYDELTPMLLAEDYERRVAEFEGEVEAEIRRRLVADRGAADVARTLRRPLPEDADFLTASASQIADLREIAAPMARKLAARLADRQRRRRRGPLDFRRTVRASLSTGGVPMTPVFRPPRPVKPELVIVADISGSVSVFAEFTLSLTYALRTEFARVRSFVFVDTVDEVTELLAGARDIAAAAAQINARGCGVWLDGRSDYGNALRSFRERYGHQLTRRTTVLVLGDARANYHASGAEALREVARRAGHLFWLNPEPSAAWDSGDSVMREYATFCDCVFECRNARQLRAFIEQMG